ncbi:MAG: flavoprotein [Moraxellaceae bacterium]|nr:MAG: flavoprotein [Moraxellaceae bacterium]
MQNKETVVIIGAGPVGIAAAAQLIERGLKPIVLEKGQTVGTAMLEWGHVRVFTPWKFLVDTAVEKLLLKTSWSYPDKEHMPTGREIVEQYLMPAATQTALASTIIYGTEVIAVAKTHLSKSSTAGRDDAAYTVHFKTNDGHYNSIEAAAVIDASGTWHSPNPIGLDGLPVPGERENKAFIQYGIPDVRNKQKDDYAGKRTLVLGGGHSAINVVLDLLKLQQDSADTQIHWGLRSINIEKLLGGGINDQLPARGELGQAAKRAIDSGALSLLTPLKVHSITRAPSGLSVQISVDDDVASDIESIEVDRIIVCAGFRPDLDILRELRLDIDEIVEAPTALAPLIDPNLHSCCSVKPHGVEELTHHDKNFFIVGMKAYGRAPTFLMLTGYEQVRSIAAELAGDHEAARRVELVLPQTGVCSTKGKSPASSACCEPASPEPASCCGTSTTTASTEPPLKATSSCCDPTHSAVPAPKKTTSCCG